LPPREERVFLPAMIFLLKSRPAAGLLHLARMRNSTRVPGCKPDLTPGLKSYGDPGSRGPRPAAIDPESGWSDPGRAGVVAAAVRWAVFTANQSSPAERKL